MKRLILFLLLASTCFGQWTGTKPNMGNQIDRSHPLSNGLVGCWLMNEGAGDTVVDLSGNNNVGTLVGNTHFVPGKFGSCLLFDGASDYISITPNSGLNPISTSLTVSAWINLSAGGWIVCKNLSANADVQYGLYFDHSISRIDIYMEGALKRSSSNGSVPINVWNQVGFVWDGTSIFPFANGNNSNTSVAFSGPLTSRPYFHVGRRYNSTSSITGRVCNVQIYNRALSASEVSQLYREPFCFMQNPDQQLLAMYQAPAAPGGSAAQVIIVSSMETAFYVMACCVLIGLIKRRINTKSRVFIQ